MTQILYIFIKSNNIDLLLFKTVHIRRRHNSSFVCDKGSRFRLEDCA